MVKDHPSGKHSSEKYSLQFLFQSGPSIPLPFPECGEDPTADELDCKESTCG